MTVEQTVEITAEGEQFEEAVGVEVEPEVAQDSAAGETTNFLDQAINQSEISMETAQEDITAEGQSSANPLEVSQETPREQAPRETRARSVPSSGSSSPRSRSTRASTEDREKPRNLRKAKALEIIVETNSPVPSPGPLTRRRSQLQLAEEGDNSPRTPTVMTRRRSMLMDEAPAPATPTTPTTRRMTRAASKDSLAPSEPEKTPEETTTLTRQRSLRKRTTSASDAEDAKSTRSTRSSRKKSETPSSSSKVTPEKAPPAEPTEETSLSNRRLTRKQMQVLEKSRQLAERMASSGALRATKSEDLQHGDDSDNESVKSDSGSVASSRASRKRNLPKRFVSQDDSSSIASKSSVKSNSPSAKWNKLSMIPEESMVEGEQISFPVEASISFPSHSTDTPVKRTRKTKK
jgi:hypothetical protein